MAPLDGVLVLDFTRAVAGPFCTMMLGDLGARVIKIEEPGVGDETRQWGPPFVEGESAYFLSMNRNKESVAVDLKSDEGEKLVAALARRADVVIENFRPGVAGRLGIGYEDLARENQRLVYASISGFGQTGPDRLRAGYDLVIQAASGLMHASGTEETGPVKVVFPVADILTSLFAGQAILAALYSRERTGKGRWIEVSLLEGMLCAMSNVCSSYLQTGKEPQRVGTAQANIVPYQLFQCQDAPIVAGALNERMWERFCGALGRREWLEDERFQGNAKRMAHRKELVGLIESVLREKRAAEWLAVLEARELPCGPVRTLGEAIGQAQVAARGGVVEMEHARVGKIRAAANPMRFSDWGPEYRAAAELGRDTERVKKEFLG